MYKTWSIWLILLTKHCCLRSVEVSIRRWFLSLRTSMEERNRLFLGLTDRQTLQLQHRDGTPVDVPDPRNRIFIDFKGMQRLLKISRFYFFMKPYLQSVLNVIEMRSIIRTFARFKLFFLGCSMKMTSLSKRTFYWRFLGSPPSSL